MLNISKFNLKQQLIHKKYTEICNRARINGNRILKDIIAENYKNYTSDFTHNTGVYTITYEGLYENKIMFSLRTIPQDDKYSYDEIKFFASAYMKTNNDIYMKFWKLLDCINYNVYDDEILLLRELEKNKRLYYKKVDAIKNSKMNCIEELTKMRIDL